MMNTLPFTEYVVLFVAVFGASIASYDLDASATFFINIVFEFLKYRENLQLFSKKVDQCLSSAIIGKYNKVFISF